MAMKTRAIFLPKPISRSVRSRIASPSREVIKRAKLRGLSMAAAEMIQHTLHQSLRAFEKRRQQVFERMEAKRAAEGTDGPR
jgi:hypothetical protein